MDKIILKTLIYADIFDYPLKAYEIHKWLIGRKATLRQIEKTLIKLNQESRVKNKGGYYFLSKRAELVVKRKRREKQSKEYFKKARLLSSILRPVSWIKLVGISGGLAMDNATKGDDIDLFIITSKNRLWITRLLVLGLFSLIGQRRKAEERVRKIAGKLCINTLLEEDRLEQSNKDIYLAHEVLQMKVLWQRDGMYQKYLEDNEWALRFLPNWVDKYRVSSIEYKGKRTKTHYTLYTILYTITDLLENLAKKFQLWYMKSPKGMERIQDGAVYFHPNDCRSKILQIYHQNIKKVISP